MYVLNCFCMTQNQQEQIILSACFFNCAINQGNLVSLRHDFVYIELPNNITDLNYLMCGYWNREGINCGKYKHGYWPLAYSYDLTCVACNNDKYNWIYLMLLLFIPSTGFYIFVLFFKLNVTSSHLHGFVFFSQIIYTPIIMRILVSLSLYFYGTIEYFGKAHLPYAIVAIIVLLVFIITPTLLLLLYPFAWFQRLLSKCFSGTAALIPSIPV